MNLYVTQKLRQRLLIYPALLIVAIPISYFFAAYSISTVRSHPRWFNESHLMRIPAKHAIKLFHEWHPDQVKALPLGEILLADMPEDFKELLGGGWYEDWTDGWGNPYRVVIQDAPTGRSIGIYSTGADGVSSSQGNDPDDINSWGQDGLAHYQPIGKRKYRLKHVTETLFYLWFVFPVIAGFYEFGRTYLKFPEGLCQKCGYDLRGNANANCPECGHAS